MEHDRRVSLIVGLFVVGALALLAGVILSLSAQRGFWRPHYRLVAYFDNVQGLIEGAPVRLAGKDVGTVTSVTFGPLGGPRPPVRVEMEIDSSVRERIRADSVASIGTIGLLGDKYVEITMGTPSARVLLEGQVLQARTPLDVSDVVAKGVVALDRIAKLTENVNQVVEDFGTKMGGRRLAESVAAVSEIVDQIQNGEGLLHSLIYDRYEGSGVESIEHSLATLEDILEEVENGQGLLHTLIYEPPGQQDLVTQTREAATHLNSILAKVDRGEGTLGLLLNDPTLFEDLKLLVGNARRSFLVRSLIRLTGSGDGD